MNARTPMNPTKKNGKNWLEWTVFAISLLLVVATVAVLGVQASQGGSEPPDLDVTLGQLETRGGWTRVPVKVTNRGNRAVQDVSVQVTGTGPLGPVRAICYFDLIPDTGEREGIVQFRTDQLEALEPGAAVIGFSRP